MIVVAGEALVDLILRPDGTIAAVPGGGPYNAARAIGRLGVPVAWIGGLSSDRFGRDLEAGLTADGVTLDLVQRTDLPTTLALAELDAVGRRDVPLLHRRDVRTRRCAGAALGRAAGGDARRACGDARTSSWSRSPRP